MHRIYVNTIAEAFLHHENRRVDKGACIQFRGRRYETKPELIGLKVEIAYDPVNPEILTISHPGIDPFTAKPLVISGYCAQAPSLPPSMQPETPKTSRLLDALEARHKESKRLMTDAISFANYGKEGRAHV